MKAAIVGPLCLDEIVVGDRKVHQPGGVCFYTGKALESLGADVSIFATHGPDAVFDGIFNSKLAHIKKPSTIRFVNKYPDKNNPDSRIQKAVYAMNTITSGDLKKYGFTRFDYIILGPLLNDSFSEDAIRFLHGKAKLVLAPQGMVRYIKDGKIIWKNPENVLRVLKYFDYVFLDDAEILFISGKKTIDDAVEVFRSRQAKNIIVTIGSRGSVVFFKNARYEISPIKPERVVDPTGAGDSYMAGFLVGMEIYGEPVKAGEFASAVATRAIEAEGPFSKLVAWGGNPAEFMLIS